MPPDVLIDLTRLVTRFSRPVPNGIDRVDIGFARHILSEETKGSGAVWSPTGLRLVDPAAGRAVLEELNAHWQERRSHLSASDEEGLYALLKAGPARARAPAENRHDGNPDRRSARSSLARLLARGTLLGPHGLWPGRSLVKTAAPGSIYVNVSQFPVWCDRYFGWLDRRPDIRAVFFVHDVLPIRYPEFFPASEEARHRGRLQVLGRRASGLIVSSGHMREALETHFRDQKIVPPRICVAPIPVADAFVAPAEPAEALPCGQGSATQPPYFVILGTIEPRKNHLLLLQLWRDLQQEYGAGTPRLLVAGVRGWDCENVVDMLERCDRLHGLVFERRGLSSPALRRLMRASRALLVPTLAEGYGLPVQEAIAAGVPVIASDIEAFRGLRDVPGVTLVDPLDGPGWRRAITSALESSASTPELRSKPPSAHLPPTWPLQMGHIFEFFRSLSAQERV